MPATELAGLSLNTLELLDPRIELLFQKLMTEVTVDCMNRPREKGKRKVTIELYVEPVSDPDTGECEEVKVSIDGNRTLPKLRTPAYLMQPSKAGLKFQPDVAEEERDPRVR